MLKWLDIRRRRLRVAARQWLRAHPRTNRLLHAAGCLSTRDGALARGVGIGLFIALLPIAGVQTPLTVAACMAARGNFPIAFAVSWVSNPVTWPPLYLFFHILGDSLVAPLIRPFLGVTASSEGAFAEALWIGLGSLLVAIPVAMLGFMITRWFELRWQQRHAQSQAAGPQARSSSG